MRIRTASADDAAAIAQVHVDSWLTTYSGLVSEIFLQSLRVERRRIVWDRILTQLPPDQTLIVAETEEHGIIGFLHAGSSREPDMGYDSELYAVYLLAEVQGRGWGRMLFERMVADMREKGHTSLHLWVLEGNPAIAFYQRMGGWARHTKEIQIGDSRHTEIAMVWDQVGWTGNESASESSAAERAGAFPDKHTLASFIAGLNRDPKHHVGYCGQEPEEIEHALEHEFPALVEAFAVQMERGELVGALGLDIDAGGRSAEIWGPFLSCPQDEWQRRAMQLWHRMRNELAHRVDTFYGFYHEMNRNAQQWMMQLGAELKSTEVVLEAERSLHTRHAHPSVREISSLRSEEFLRLHKSVFPGTYRSGPDILERINENYCVFMFEDEDGLQGYIYVEREPEFDEGRIEFIAVAPSARGRGIGAALLQRGLGYLFEDPRIEKITLCVRADNEQALHLYRRAGFRELHRLRFYAIAGQE
ncbi:GNAT family N-acetyltransferase [Paenibacillus thiaminolyticus]|uniref:GNAT family N-acetyltransferase n=1 Tax=Paenibacillus thiaminolyticus TaxID=49283 RepID=A0A3A3GHR5_PANTH|nr:GNAT family N-acetyltransferase [Paenibacillus thiaminolyticus]RJG23624.1 GNAT family N-acetyltransferase [Paenibacillus thiaminolyticus]